MVAVPEEDFLLLILDAGALETEDSSTHLKYVAGKGRGQII
jgi:hypothetical protein